MIEGHEELRQNFQNLSTEEMKAQISEMREHHDEMMSDHDTMRNEHESMREAHDEIRGKLNNEERSNQPES